MKDGGRVRFAGQELTSDDLQKDRNDITLNYRPEGCGSGGPL